MNTDRNTLQATVGPSSEPLVRETCDAFEASWRRGETPRIEDYLGRAEPQQRPVLLRQLLMLDLAYRRQNGERPHQEEYLLRFSDQEKVLQQVFSSADSVDQSDATPPFAARGDNPGHSVSMSTRYSRLRFHDEGGLGEVYLACDEDLGRDVAIKFVRPQHAANQEMVTRFRIEAEVTSRLDHPGVVPLYAMGESWDGRPCYAMRFIEGMNLRAAIQQFHKTDWNTRGRSARRLELHRLLGHLVAACDTVAYAHNRGVLHRDIKPDNIMLGRYGETLIVDWGLAQFVRRDEQAKASGEKTLMPEMTPEDKDSSGSRGGTVGYMSPEQLPDSLMPVSKACDVYSLGATLYKLLTGETAFHSREGHRVWDKIRRGECRRPCELNPDCPPALEAICLKAMALDPQDRYATATGLARDLRHWMADEPVDVYPEPLFERLTRLARRHRAWSFAIASILAIVLLLTGLGMLLFGRQAQRERQLRKQAETAEQIAERARLSNLRSAAVFAANTYGYEIDQRWRVLSELAAEAELGRLIEAMSGKSTASPEQTALQNWLMMHSSEILPDGKADSWFIDDALGRQLARNPWKSSIGHAFRHRSYFHGGPRDVTSEEAELMEPITQPSLSAVYESTATHELKVSFTVPIWGERSNHDAPPIGVVGMSVKLGDFVQLESELRGMCIVLVDLRTDWLEGEPKAGLILDRPNLDAARLAQAARTGRSLLRIDPGQIGLLEQLRQQRNQQRGWTGEVSGRPADFFGLVPNFLDPAAAPSESACIAAVEPVFVPGRDESLADTGWFVIIEDYVGESSGLNGGAAGR
jgi:serine/threonine-protein kinase